MPEEMNTLSVQNTSMISHHQALRMTQITVFWIDIVGSSTALNDTARHPELGSDLLQPQRVNTYTYAYVFRCQVLSEAGPTILGLVFTLFVSAGRFWLRSIHRYTDTQFLDLGRTQQYSLRAWRRERTFSSQTFEKRLSRKIRKFGIATQIHPESKLRGRLMGGSFSWLPLKAGGICCSEYLLLWNRILIRKFNYHVSTTSFIPARFCRSLVFAWSDTCSSSEVSHVLACLIQCNAYGYSDSGIYAHAVDIRVSRPEKGP